jgi:hypothetical protein
MTISLRRRAEQNPGAPIRGGGCLDARPAEMADAEGCGSVLTVAVPSEIGRRRLLAKKHGMGVSVVVRLH